MSKILIIDDEATFAAAVRRRLSSAGYDALVATRLDAGLQEAETHAPDVVLLDVHLPDGNGLSVIERLTGGPGRPEVIILTGDEDPQGVDHAVHSGAWAYVIKGGPFSDVEDAVKTAMQYRDSRDAPEREPLELAGVIGSSTAMKACLARLGCAAASDASVLLTGESGTGKELFAWAIRQNSRRRARPFVVVDCAALPESLVESMIFGHRRGSFTGAVESRVGLVEQANGGTLFLDEVGEMPLAIQKSFLRVLQEKRFRPVGSDHEIDSDFRVIAATNRDLEERVRAGAFRADLLFRLKALSIRLPPLRERGDDVHEIAAATLTRICDREGLPRKSLSAPVRDVLGRYHWPGNVRELVNALEHAVAAATDHQTLYPIHLPPEIRVFAARMAIPAPRSSEAPQMDAPAPPLGSLRDYRDAATKRYLLDLLAAAGDDVNLACSMSGLSRSRLYALLKEHDVGRRHLPEMS